MTPFSQHRLIAFLALLLAANAFQRPSHHSLSRRRAATPKTMTTSLDAWSLTPPANFGGFKSTWYEDLENPTLRRTVYEESPHDFHFATTGSDWPTIGDTASSESSSSSLGIDASQRRIRINPIKRAQKWLTNTRNNKQRCLKEFRVDVM